MNKIQIASIIVALYLTGCGVGKPLKTAEEGTTGGFGASTTEDGNQIGVVNGPAPLASFSGSVSSGSNSIELSWAYPADMGRYTEMRLLRITGTTAPNADCGSGTLVGTFRAPWSITHFSDAQVSDSPSYSYRFCIYDSAMGLTSTNYLANIGLQVTTPPVTPPTQPPVVDTQAPPSLTQFGGATNASKAGFINLYVDFPINTSDYAKVEIHRASGATPPVCSLESRLYTVLPPYVDTVIEDDTGSRNGGGFSYRACIWDAVGNLTADAILSNIQIADTKAPDPLVAFTGATGLTHGAVRLNLDFPNDVSDYSTVSIRRLEGGAPASCSDGAPISVPVTVFQDGPVDDITGSNSGASFGYRVCILDRAGNLTSSNVITTAVAAKDLQAPPTLAGSTGSTSTSVIAGIRLSWSYPSDISDYAKLEIYRNEGSSPPSSCSGSPVYTVTDFNITSRTDVGGDTNTYYSYRFCITDKAGNLVPLGSANTTVNNVKSANCLGNIFCSIGATISGALGG